MKSIQKGEYMIRRESRKYITAVLAVVLLTAGCSSQAPGGVAGGRTPSHTSGADSSTEKPDKKIEQEYNIKIKAVVMKLDTEAKVIQLKNSSGGLGYTLTYSPAVQIWDKYGGSRMMEEVKEGDIVEAYIDDNDGRLAGLVYSSENWEFAGSRNWSFNTEKSELTIGREKYFFSDNMVILSEGEEASIMDLHKSDCLNIQGCGKRVLSVTVEKGHGYVKLEGITDFLGGWVEIGKVIKPISEEMLIAVPEGNWDVTVVKEGYGGSIAATVERNKECTVDFTEVASKIVRYGTVEITVEPEDAKLYIAGREMDYNNQILLEYDVYKIRVSADGYEDYTGDLRVDRALVSRRISLDKVSASEEPSSSPSPTSSAAPSDTPTPAPASEATQAPDENAASESPGVSLSPYTIKVDCPTSHVNVYFDDAFVGVSPVSFIKISGNHTITLSKAGYVTKSYSVEIGTEEKDVSFNLPQLEHER